MRKILGIILAISLIATAVTGCTRTSVDETDGGKTKFTWWIQLYPHIAQTANNFAEVEFYKGLAEKTGVEIEFIHPPAGQETEKFNLMIASDELPDFITTNFLDYKGGPSKALKDGVLVDLTEPIKDYAPNLTKLLKDNPDWDKQVKLDDGSYYVFPFLRGDDYLLSWTGPIVRRDLLDKFGLDAPETVEEWDNMLRTFKKGGVEIPLSLPNYYFADHSMFVGAFGLTSGLYVDDGVVKYGEMQDEYAEFLKVLASWYKDKLLDADFFAHDTKTYNSKITSGKVGSFVASAGGGLGTFIPSLSASNPEIKLEGVKFVSSEKGALPEFGFKDNVYTPLNSVGITSSCKDVKKAVEFFDWGYGEEGSMYWNFGTEGVSYTLEDGYPKYTDLILNNPDGLAMMYSMGRHIASVYGGPFVQDKRYYEQYMQYPEQQQALVTWSQQDKTKQHKLPPVTLTTDESTELAGIITDIKTYQDEMIIKFITGQEDLKSFDSFRKELKKFGIERYVEIYQKAYDRYIKRK